MRTGIGVAYGRKLFGVVAAMVACLLTFRGQTQAQGGSQGQNAVCTSTSQFGCAPAVGTSAFIDASTFSSKEPNICLILNYILTNGFPAGAVIDARGLPGSTGTSLTCTASPWTGIASPLPSTILLPAGTIVIPATWYLPSGTHLIGQGDTAGSGTTLRASSGFSGAMLQLGSSSSPAWCSSTNPCTGIGVEKLVLDGQGQTVVGISNPLAQTQSYIDQVSLYQILGTGLQISGSANNSGPYTNIKFDTGPTYPAASSTICVQIEVSGTRGVRGLSCNVSTSSIANAAVLLDSSSNSIKDVTTVGFKDGILVGGNARATSDVLINVISDTQNPCKIACSFTINDVHISSAFSATSNIVILGASNQGGTGTATIDDD